MKSTTYERASGTIHISLLQFPCNRVGLILGNDLSPVVLSNKLIVCARRQAQATGVSRCDAKVGHYLATVPYVPLQAKRALRPAAPSHRLSIAELAPRRIVYYGAILSSEH